MSRLPNFLSTEKVQLRAGLQSHAHDNPLVLLRPSSGAFIRKYTIQRLAGAAKAKYHTFVMPKKCCSAFIFCLLQVLALCATTYALPLTSADEIPLEEQASVTPGGNYNGIDYGTDFSWPMHHASVSTNYPWLPHNMDPVNNPIPEQYRGMPLKTLGDSHRCTEVSLKRQLI